MMRVPLPKGTRVRTKVQTLNGDGGIGEIVEDTGDAFVTILLECGPCLYGREEIAVLRDQSGQPIISQRKRLPYGKWTYEDGTEVLFNRDYELIWQRRPGQAAVPADPKKEETFGAVTNKEMYFGDGAAYPWGRRTKAMLQSRARCERVLAEWGVNERR